MRYLQPIHRLALLLALALAACTGGGATEGETTGASEAPEAVQCGAGMRDCPCGEHDACDVNLVCSSGICRETRGFAGAACFGNGTCDPGYLCEKDVCVECEPGSPGCACAAGACDNGLTCTNDRCIVAPELMVQRRPADPICYTPCTDDWIDDNGEPHTCANGLMLGCLNDYVCNDGSCVKPGDPPPSCATDLDCPDYQVCVGGGAGPTGRCYSNCDATADCDPGMACTQHACRQTCDTAANTCGTGMTCRLVDSTGACFPVRVKEPGPPVVKTAGSFKVTDDPMRFSNIDITRTITIHNGANRPLDFIVRKRQPKADGGRGNVETPLPYVKLSVPGGQPTDASQLPPVRIEAGRDATVTVAVVASTIMPATWEGLLEVEQPDLGIRRVAMSYTQKADSRFTGNVYYFTNFSDTNLAAWRNLRTSNALLWNVHNAFVQKWGAFRNGTLSSVKELDAMIQATTSGSWDWPTTRNACQSGAACYLFDNGSGYDTAGTRAYTTDLVNYPIPTGITTLPIAVDLQLTTSKKLSGRIASELSLQYPGNPAFALDFDNDVASCLANRTNACVSTIKRLTSTVTMGARMPVPSSGSCDRANSLDPVTTPWLLPDFTVGTKVDDTTHVRNVLDCRDSLQPLPAGITNAASLNRSLSGANPIPDGKVRKRTLELIDGYMVDKDTIYLLFTESFDADFLGKGGPAFSVYGLMQLRRTPAQLPADAFVGNAVPETRTIGRDPSADLQCSPEIVQQLLGPGATVSAANADQLAAGLISGMGSATPPETYPDNEVHYLCDDGTFDGPCAAGHDALYFAGDGLTSPLTGESCNGSHSCRQRLVDWRSSLHTVENVPYKCVDGGSYCDTDRLDLKHGKTFFKASTATTVLLPLRAQVDHAFRYATQFRSRLSDSRVGFRPAVCEPLTHTTKPYCYDPAEIERTQARVDCLIDTARRYPAALSAETAAKTQDYLASDFGYDMEARVGQDPLRHDGFERMYAELLVMLGDDAYTTAFRSRFDLAGMLGGDFQGTKFEVNGVNLSGGLGKEMSSLYQATQYYQLVLDRFYRLVPGIWTSLTGVGPQFVTQRTVTSYFAHLLNASTQKAEAFNEIAKRYQKLNRPDLARQVISRAYAATYLESLAFGRMMSTLVDEASPEDVDQIRLSMKLATASYDHALLQMREHYAAITDTVTMFGFAPDYVPLPGGNTGDIFMRAYNDAMIDLGTATTAENDAIHDDHAFETDSATFQSTLDTINRTYDTRLREICGNMQGSDGVVYPAIAKYAGLNKRASVLGDPCGFMDGGQIKAAMDNVSKARIDTLQVAEGYAKVQGKIDNELQRIDELCGANGVITTYADIVYNDQISANGFQASIDAGKAHIAGILRNTEAIGKGLQLMFCMAGPGGTDCPTKAGVSVLWAATLATTELSVFGAQLEIDKAAKSLGDLQANGARMKVLHECDQAKVNSNATIRDLTLEYADLDLQALKADYQMRIALDALLHMRQEAAAIMQEEEESQQMAISIEASRNDPNTRIYRNDTVQRADSTFARAIAKAYRATKAYEYLTGKSYADISSLLLIRMITRGQPNLADYMANLKDAYDHFTEHYIDAPGVMVVSLMDDVLDIPRIGLDGLAIPVGERQRLLRQRLNSPELLNKDGFVEMPFATLLWRIPLLSAMSKIDHIEVEFSGSNVGDAQGHLQVTQQGTSTLQRLDGTTWFLRLESGQALANIFFNGFRAHVAGNADFYKNRQLKDRPVVNGDWKLVLDQRADIDNQDIDLNSITDVKLYIYYTFYTPHP
jgi:hypothetical protein